MAPQRFVELDHGLGDLTLCQVDSAQIIVGNCQFRVPPKGCQIMAFRLFQISIRKKSVCETKLSVRVIRLESKNCPKLADAVVIFAHCHKESCVAVMRVS